jgi:predicted PurR-regulated permease PerM
MNTAPGVRDRRAICACAFDIGAWCRLRHRPFRAFIPPDDRRRPRVTRHRQAGEEAEDWSDSQDSGHIRLMNDQTREHAAAAKPPAGRIGTLVLAAGAAAGIIVCIFLAVPFLGALTWALALAILFVPLHARIEKRLKNANLSAVVSVLIISFIVAVPVIFVVERIVQEAATSAAVIQDRIASGAIQRLLDLHPGLAPVGQWIAKQIDLPAIAASLSTWLSNVGTSFVRGSIVQLTEAGLTFYFLFYFLRDQRAAADLLRDWLPLTPVEAEMLFGRVTDTVRATVYGTVLVAVVQGTLGGLMFWFLGLPAPVLWGLVMALLSIVPVLGSFVVWIPAAVLLALNGDWGKAVVLTVWGGVVVGGIDNLLRPMIIGNRLRLHTVPAFVAMVGGLVVFGMSGFILGPLAVSVTIVLLRIAGTRRPSIESGEPQ